MFRTEAITIHFDPEAARLYREASDEQRQRIEMWLNICLKEFCIRPHDLCQTIQEVREEAQMRGLTPEVLQSILDEDPAAGKGSDQSTEISNGTG